LSVYHNFFCLLFHAFGRDLSNLKYLPRQYSRDEANVRICQIHICTVLSGVLEAWVLV